MSVRDGAVRDGAVRDVQEPDPEPERARSDFGTMTESPSTGCFLDRALAMLPFAMLPDAPRRNGHERVQRGPCDRKRCTGRRE